jgi:hypothetical protein
MARKEAARVKSGQVARIRSRPFLRALENPGDLDEIIADAIDCQKGEARKKLASATARRLSEEAPAPVNAERHPAGWPPDGHSPQAATAYRLCS